MRIVQLELCAGQQLLGVVGLDQIELIAVCRGRRLNSGVVAILQLCSVGVAGGADHGILGSR